MVKVHLGGDNDEEAQGEGSELVWPGSKALGW